MTINFNKKNEMEFYNKIEKYIIKTGDRIIKRTGKIQDIGITKKDLTEEDLRIEKELSNLIKKNNPNHEIYAEEQQDKFIESDNLWVIDPISGTNIFINGEPHFAIVVTHLFKNEIQFAIVYDPSTKELFKSIKDQGAYLNGNKISVSNRNDVNQLKLLIVLSDKYKGEISSKEVYQKLEDHRPYRIRASFALQYCYVACGRFDGCISMTKDVFPEFAGSLLIREAGGIFTNEMNEVHLNTSDRIFLGGSQLAYKKLQSMQVIHS